jgi:hypothetical protein
MSASEAVRAAQRAWELYERRIPVQLSLRLTDEDIPAIVPDKESVDQQTREKRHV